jgi:hypothetical protein
MLIMGYKHELLQLQLHLNILFAHLLVTLNNSLNSVVDFVYLLSKIYSLNHHLESYLSKDHFLYL